MTGGEWRIDFDEEAPKRRAYFIAEKRLSNEFDCMIG